MKREFPGSLGAKLDCVEILKLLLLNDGMDTNFKKRLSFSQIDPVASSTRI